MSAPNDTSARVETTQDQVLVLWGAVEKVEGAVRFCYPDDMTPPAKIVIDDAIANLRVELAKAVGYGP